MKCLVVFVAVLAVSAAQFNFNARQSRPYARPVAPIRAAASAVTVTRAAPPPAPRPVSRGSSSDQTANIVRYDSDISPDGSYNYAYETDNGIAAQETGTPRALGGNPPETPVVAQGSFAYTSPEGLPVSLSYIADENGFQPTSDVLPVGPPIPPQILRALEWLARNAPPQKK